MNRYEIIEAAYRDVIDGLAAALPGYHVHLADTGSGIYRITVELTDDDRLEMSDFELRDRSSHEYWVVQWYSNDHDHALELYHRDGDDVSRLIGFVTYFCDRNYRALPTSPPAPGSPEPDSDAATEVPAVSTGQLRLWPVPSRATLEIIKTLTGLAAERQRIHQRTLDRRNQAITAQEITPPVRLDVELAADKARATTSRHALQRTLVAAGTDEEGGKWMSETAADQLTDLLITATATGADLDLYLSPG